MKPPIAVMNSRLRPNLLASHPEIVRAYLEAHRQELRVLDLDLAAFLCVATVEALTHAAVVNRPDVLSDKAGVFTEEVTRLVVGCPRGR